MYHPAEGGEEYIELHNPAPQLVELYEDAGPWRLNGGVEFELPPGFSLAGGARLILVDFDPAVETGRLDNFITLYQTGPLVPGVDILGSWSGDLSNSTERIALEKPLMPDLPDMDIPWVIVDQVQYSDQAPWPHEADGTGRSLQRIAHAAGASGNDPANWNAEQPSPGR